MAFPLVPKHICPGSGVYNIASFFWRGRCPAVRWLTQAEATPCIVSGFSLAAFTPLYPSESILRGSRFTSPGRARPSRFSAPPASTSRANISLRGQPFRQRLRSALAPTPATPLAGAACSLEGGRLRTDGVYSWLAAFTISTKSGGLQAAPPIRPPSTSGWASSSWAFLAFMEPPYWMVTERATRAPYSLRMTVRMARRPRRPARRWRSCRCRWPTGAHRR